MPILTKMALKSKQRDMNMATFDTLKVKISKLVPLQMKQVAHMSAKEGGSESEEKSHDDRCKNSVFVVGVSSARPCPADDAFGSPE